MKKILLLLALPASLFSQNVVTLTCKKLVSCEAIDSLNLYEPAGLGYKLVQRAGRTADNSYVFKVPAGAPKFYAMGSAEAASTFVILGDEPEVTMYGDCAKLEYSRAMGKQNIGYYNLKKRINAMVEAEQNATTALRMAMANPSQTAAIENYRTAVRQLEFSKNNLLDSLKKANPTFAKIAALHLPPNPLALDKNPYPTDYEYVASEYFKNANLTDAAFNGLPDLIDAFDQFGRVLTAMPLMAEKQKEFADRWLSKFQLGSAAHRLALAGLLRGFQLTNSPNYLEFAKVYIANYQGKDNGESRMLSAELDKSRTSMIGAEVPDLAGMTPDGKQFSLKEMRGKYVLLDFWASWCGPCRRENPNVKANYEKFKDKGFDILSVSLDRTLEAWKNAIEADGMPWKHISDLKGWQSEHARLYSVTSIPRTLLLDPQGRLVAKDLRGEQLGLTLEQIFSGK